MSLAGYVTLHQQLTYISALGFSIPLKSNVLILRLLKSQEPSLNEIPRSIDDQHNLIQRSRESSETGHTHPIVRFCTVVTELS